MTPPSIDSEGGRGRAGKEKGADAVTTRTTFAPVTESISSGGAGGAPVTLATGGSSRGPWQRPQGTPDLRGKSLTGPALPPAPGPAASARTPGQPCFLAPKSIYILIRSGFKPPGSLARGRSAPACPAVITKCTGGQAADVGPREELTTFPVPPPHPLP